MVLYIGFCGRAQSEQSRFSTSRVCALRRVSNATNRAKEEFAAADMECMDMEAVLEFAEKLVERPKQLWLESSLEQKQRLQEMFFRTV